MQLNEVIEENSLATISKRTRISVENIEKLVNRDFSSMKRVKALGFISILEREFHIKLDSLKTECIEYFSPYPEEEFDAKLVVTIPESHENRGGYLSKFLVLLLLIAMGYGAWYFFAQDKNTFRENNTTQSSTGSSFIGSIVDQAKAWLGNSNSLEENSTLDTPSNTDGVWAKSNTEAVEENLPAEKADTEQEEKSIEEKNDTALEEQIIRKVKEEQQEILAKKSEANITEVLTIEGLLQEESITVDDTPAVEAIENTLAVEVPSMIDETNADEIVAIETKKTERKIKEIPKKKEDIKVKKTTKKKMVILHPSKKVWVGYTNLETMRREAKVIEKDIEFDTGSGSWILIAGHNAFNFIIKGKTITPKKRAKNYFLIKNGKVKAIPKKEFQKLNKSTVW